MPADKISTSSSPLLLLIDSNTSELYSLYNEFSKG